MNRGQVLEKVNAASFNSGQRSEDPFIDVTDSPRAQGLKFSVTADDPEKCA